VDKELIALSKKLLTLALARSITIATAESCSGGMVATQIVSLPGASQIFDCGLVTYSNNSKTKLLGVKKSTLKKYGAVSRQVAEEMAYGAIEKSSANLSVSITGIAGPNSCDSIAPGKPTKPNGLVFIASYNKLNENLINKELHFTGDRYQIMQLCALEALKILIQQINIK
jgi:PncC family amidohydrolase